jgi:hypothetical protein
MKTIAQLFAEFNENIKPLVIEQYGADDTPAMSEAWNDFTDSECKEGQITDLIYHFCPAFDDEMPDDDYQFILDAMNVTFSSVRQASRSDDLSDWAEDASHWKILIKHGSKEMTAFYSMGSAHTGVPSDTDVFSSLLSDTSDIEGASFEDWAHSLGYDTDSRKAEKIFQACERTLLELKQLFSESELNDLREIFSDY